MPDNEKEPDALQYYCTCEHNLANTNKPYPNNSKYVCEGCTNFSLRFETKSIQRRLRIQRQPLGNSK